MDDEDRRLKLPLRLSRLQMHGLGHHRELELSVIAQRDDHLLLGRQSTIERGQETGQHLVHLSLRLGAGAILGQGTPLGAGESVVQADRRPQVSLRRADLLRGEPGRRGQLARAPGAIVLSLPQSLCCLPAGPGQMIGAARFIEDRPADAPEQVGPPVILPGRVETIPLAIPGERIDGLAQAEQRSGLAIIYAHPPGRPLGERPRLGLGQVRVSGGQILLLSGQHIARIRSACAVAREPGIRAMTDTGNAIVLSAEIGCPACGRRIAGAWAPGSLTAGQRCACGHAFPATWPGWAFQPSVSVADTSP